ncbi:MULTISPECIES: hypothetical protein [unclassified Fusibacter]|uniref:hypothetical protein n=1 Tax=unclassified Fusibacter TaxID=2624464 RepID=UPI0010121802|nr:MULTISPECIES: hypothetical protein [unclassified Fusibacter]MCK8061631.1 hypothetical protein [Fusibacter sp. A2]NPE23815.1 hypothetical protein [Fusibacter sp. A1]RXV58653.1 hypothetical protein DWB64_18690 [Fusibacter sp. A1]
MRDFEEIAHAGGKITIEIVDNSYGFNIEHSIPTAFKVGQIREEIFGIEVPIFMISDSEGMYGSLCNSCDSYFRSAVFIEKLICPYCGIKDNIGGFFTKNQQIYIKVYKDTFLTAIMQKKTMVIDFDRMNSNKLMFNTKVYSEMRQQTKFICDNCSNITDILGVYGYCPRCGVRNTYSIYKKKSNLIKSSLQSIEVKRDEQHVIADTLADLLKRSISNFDGFGKDIKNELISKLCIDKKKNFNKELSFQRVKQADDILFKEYGIGLFEGISSENIELIIKMFQIRHLYEHGSGIIDEEYIKKSGDNTAKIGSLLRVDLYELRDFCLTMDSLVGKFWSSFLEKGYFKVQ